MEVTGRFEVPPVLQSAAVAAALEPPPGRDQHRRPLHPVQAMPSSISSSARKAPVSTRAHAQDIEGS